MCYKLSADLIWKGMVVRFLVCLCLFNVLSLREAEFAARLKIDMMHKNLGDCFCSCDLVF